MDIRIGKYTLETLTSGMYDSPKDIYREYIQNAVDSIDAAIKAKSLQLSESKVEVVIDKLHRKIEIIDNGTGISSEKAQEYLLNIGDSVKLNTENRGFRGIGRLAGLAYCDKLIFSTSYSGEEIKTEIAFDAKLLRDNMSSVESNDSLVDIFTNVISVEIMHETKSKHYFKVTLSEVNDIDNLLNDKAIYEYLSEVAPVPFSPTFVWKDIIKSKLRYRGLDISEYNVFIKGETVSGQIYKNYQDIFVADRVRKAEDSIKNIEEVVFSVDDEPLAILWLAQTDYVGTVQNKSIKGIRLRKGNIQLGARNVLNSIFRDERFNGWLIGEVHIISHKLIPNARRDGLEKTTLFYALQEQMRQWADKISSKIRKVSTVRCENESNKKLASIIKTNSSLDNIPSNVTAISEIEIQDNGEYEDIAYGELIRQLDILINQKQVCTQYKALNLQTGLTIEEKKILAIIFDIIKENEPSKADRLISLIIKQYKVKNFAMN